jgi:hypothetical protein
MFCNRCKWRFWRQWYTPCIHQHGHFWLYHSGPQLRIAISAQGSLDEKRLCCKNPTRQRHAQARESQPSCRRPSAEGREEEVEYCKKNSMPGMRMRVMEWRGSGEYAKHANKNQTFKINEVCRLHLIKVKICCRHGLKLVCKNAGCQLRSVCQPYECLLLKLEHAGTSGNSALLGGSFSRNRSLAEVVNIGHALLATISARTTL